MITDTEAKCTSILIKTTTTATRTCAKFENDKVTGYPKFAATLLDHCSVPQTKYKS